MILTASTGGGHNRASNALKSYINTHDPESDVRIIDAIEECSSVLNFTVVKGYKALVTLTPSLFGKIYKNSDKKSPLSDTVTFLYQQCAKRLKPVIDEYMPDVIISCHPFAGAILGYMKEQFGYLPDKYPGLKLIENPYYDKCNNIASLYVAREHFRLPPDTSSPMRKQGCDLLLLPFQSSRLICVLPDEAE